MKSIPLSMALAACSLLWPVAHASERDADSPQAGGRTYASNYKDMVLASCIEQAYRHHAGAATDAGSSVSALRDWTYFDMEKSPDAVQSLIDAYLARDYSNPLADAETPGVRFDLLKCLDLYHSKALADLVKRLVLRPTHTYRRDNPAAR